jgi:hypothetical protein
MAGKEKVPELRSGLRPSEKELPEWRSGTFCHKNALAYKNYSLQNFSMIYVDLWQRRLGYIQMT